MQTGTAGTSVDFVSMVSTLVARHAALTRYGRMDDAARTRRDLAVAVLEEAIADTLAHYPPTADQRARLVALLDTEESRAAAGAPEGTVHVT